MPSLESYLYPQDPRKTSPDSSQQADAPFFDEESGDEERAGEGGLLSLLALLICGALVAGALSALLSK